VNEVRRCDMIVSPGVEGCPENICGKPCGPDWTICEDCYVQMLNDGDFTHKELLAMYCTEKKGYK
jgi:hypothetical protein